AVPLALALAAGALGACAGGRALALPARDRRPGQRVAEPRDGGAPVRDAARRVGLRDGVEPLDRFAEPERVLQRDGALELRLHRRAARSREIDLAQALRRLRA